MSVLPTIVELFKERVAESAGAVALRYFDDGMIKTMSWSEWLRRSSRIAAFLADQGVEHGDRIALLSHTRMEWLLVDMAAWMIGAVVVPIYPTQLPKQCAWIINEVQAKFVFVEDPVQLEKIIAVWTTIDTVAEVVQISDRPSPRNVREAAGNEDALLPHCDLFVRPLREVMAEGRRTLRDQPNLIPHRRVRCKSDDIASIVYTSGTTGRPRGVVLTQGNFVAEMRACATAIHMDDEDDQLFFLPLAHILARILYLTSIVAGSTLTLSQGPSHLVEEMRSLRPTLIAGVPSVFEKLSGIATLQGTFGKGKVQRAASSWMLELARDHSRARRQGASLPRLRQAQFKVADRTLYRRVRELFGGRLRFAVSGGAALSLKVAEFFDGAGITVLEGYGLTENCGAATFNNPTHLRLGSVGRPIPDVDIDIDEDGEILLRGPNVMQGYWQDDEATAEALIDGWLHTGDYGELRDGYLYVTDRKKDIIVTSTGKNVAPVPIEARLRGLPMVRQAVVYGDGRPYLTALVTLEPATLISCAERNGVTGVPSEELTQHPRVHDMLRQQIDVINQDLPAEEHIRRFAILPGVFDVSTGELTPSEKVRRRFITEKYRPVLDGLYGS